MCTVISYNMESKNSSDVDDDSKQQLIYAHITSHDLAPIAYSVLMLFAHNRREYPHMG